MKVVVIGSSGSGKTTIAAEIAKEFNLQSISMDAIIFKDEDFSEKPLREVYRRWIIGVAQGSDNWVMEGVYPEVADALWPLADILLWLDLPFSEVRQRYEYREGVRERMGPFGDVSIHEKEHARLKREYSKSINDLKLRNLIRVSNPQQNILDNLRQHLN